MRGLPFPLPLACCLLALGAAALSGCQDAEAGMLRSGQRDLFVDGLGDAPASIDFESLTLVRERALLRVQVKLGAGYDSALDAFYNLTVRLVRGESAQEYQFAFAGPLPALQEPTPENGYTTLRFEGTVLEFAQPRHATDRGAETCAEVGFHAVRLGSGVEDHFGKARPDAWPRGQFITDC